MKKRLLGILLCCLLGSLTLLPAQSGAPVRIGVIGLSHDHVHWILGRADRGDIEVVGYVESDPAIVERLSKQYNLSPERIFPDLETFLARADPEAVTVFTPISAHLAVVEACAARRVHVMLEKPMALDQAQAHRMAEAAREGGIHLLTNYETTWYSSNHELYRLLRQDSVLGPVRKIVVHDGHSGPIEIGCSKDFTDWLTDPIQNGGGALTDFGCYGANLITWLMEGQRPVSVTAITQQIKPDIYPNVDDEATILLTYPHAQGIIQASWNWPFNRKDTHVYGATGYAKAPDGTRLQVRLAGQEEEAESRVDVRKAPFDDPFAYLAAVVRGEVNPQGSLSSLEINLVVMEILDAARRSAEAGKTIEME